MTRKKLLTVIVCIVAVAALLAAIIYAVQYAIAYVRHPAFSHDDYVYGSKIVIDNETPFEHDAELDIGDNAYYLNPFTASRSLEQILRLCGNKIIRQNDDMRYTVYSYTDNTLYYVFFSLGEEGTWQLDFSWKIDAAHSIDGEIYAEYVYEHDTPQAILGELLPENTISSVDAAQRAFWASTILHSIRYNLNLPDIRNLVADDTYAQAYRMTSSGLFPGLHYFDFYVHFDGTGTLIYRRYNSEEYSNIKEIFEDVTYSLTIDETAALVNVWNEQDFFRLPPTHPREATSMLDGTTIYLEGISGYYTEHDNKTKEYAFLYNMTHLHDPSVIYPELSTIKDAMVAMVESKGTEVRFNRTSEEEKLRSNQAAD